MRPRPWSKWFIHGAAVVVLLDASAPLDQVGPPMVHDAGTFFEVNYAITDDTSFAHHAPLRDLDLPPELKYCTHCCHPAPGYATGQETDYCLAHGAMRQCCGGCAESMGKAWLSCGMGYGPLPCCWVDDTTSTLPPPTALPTPLPTASFCTGCCYAADAKQESEFCTMWTSPQRCCSDCNDTSSWANHCGRPEFGSYKDKCCWAPKPRDSNSGRDVNIFVEEESNGPRSPAAAFTLIFICIGCTVCLPLLAAGFYCGYVYVLALGDGTDIKPQKLMLDEGLSDDDVPETIIPFGARCPPHWDYQDIYEDFAGYHEVPHSLKRLVQALLDSTFKQVKTRDRAEQMPRRLEVSRVHRIEDRKLWAGYLQQKADLKSKRIACQPVRLLDGKPDTGEVLTRDYNSVLAGGEDLDYWLNEHYLFHGTSPEGAEGISTKGFNLSLAGSSVGTMFGNGAYFAECSSKADEYARGGKGIYQGMYALLLCRVCCGELLRVLRPEPTRIDAALRAGEVDAVLGDREASVGTYREFVIFRERQVYPEYVVVYQRLFDGDEDDDDDASADSGSDADWD